MKNTKLPLPDAAKTLEAINEYMERVFVLQGETAPIIPKSVYIERLEKKVKSLDKSLALMAALSDDELDGFLWRAAPAYFFKKQLELVVLDQAVTNGGLIPENI